MNRKVRVDDCDLGKGVFADSFLPRGELILFVTGRVVTRQENDQLYHEGENSVQIGSDRYIDPCSPAVYLNHSCEPNAGIDSESRLIALRDIQPGEEIRFDYSTCMLERSWTLKCKCGAPNCRGIVDDFDLIPRPVRDFYVERHVVQEFILEALKEPQPDQAIPA